MTITAQDLPERFPTAGYVSWPLPAGEPTFGETPQTVGGGGGVTEGTARQILKVASLGKQRR